MLHWDLGGDSGGDFGAAVLAGGADGPAAVSALAERAMRVLHEGAARRGGPLPVGGPGGVVAAGVLPERGLGAAEALEEVVGALAAGSADPADPWCAGHLHCPPLAVAAAADVAASVLNPSMDSWDQAPAASALEAQVCAELARLVYAGAADPDAVITSGGTESNLLALLLARETTGLVQPVCAQSAHHSVARAAWVLGLPAPVIVACTPDGRLSIGALDSALAASPVPAVVVATAGTTDTGAVDPLPEVADVARRHGARLHVDAAYGGGVLFSRRLRSLLYGMELADTVSLDLHKFGGQPIAAGVLALRDASALAPLGTRADYLNAADDTEAGLPDLLGRSLRTSRRADAVKIAVTFAALGRDGLAALVEHCCATAHDVAAAVQARRQLQLWAPPTLSTILFRPSDADDRLVAGLRRQLLMEGTAVLGRATMPDTDGRERLWLKLTLLHPTATVKDYEPLLDLVAARSGAVVHELDNRVVLA